MWFTDFILMHKALQINDMISIEESKSNEKRAEFNKPFRCITVEIGDARSVLPTLDWDDHRIVAWLDYDKTLAAGIFNDLDVLGKHLANSGSVIIVTVNANLRQIDKTRKTKFETPQQEFVRKKAEFYKLTKGILGSQFTKDAFSDEGFSKTLASALFAKLDASCRNAGHDLKFVPIFNFFYQDNAPMITVGGMALTDEDRTLFVETDLSRLSYLKGKEQIKINVPHLTSREKLRLDRYISPVGALPTIAELEFELEEEELRGYADYYRYYPFFGEMFL